MKGDAESHAEEDKKKEELVDTKNLADSLIYSTEKILEDQGDNVSKEERQNIEIEMIELKKAIKGEDIMKIRHRIEKLQKATYSVTEKLYQNAQEQTQTTGTETSAEQERKETSKEEEEIEADYEVIEEEEEVEEGEEGEEGKKGEEGEEGEEEEEK